MPPRSSGGNLDLNQDPDALRREFQERSKQTGSGLGSIIGKVAKAYGGQTGGQKGEAGEKALKPMGGGPDAPSPDTLDRVKGAIQTAFPSTEPFFELGTKFGEMLRNVNTGQQAASRDAGYAPSQPAQTTMEWVQEFLKRQEGP